MQLNILGAGLDAEPPFPFLTEPRQPLLDTILEAPNGRSTVEFTPSQPAFSQATSPFATFWISRTPMARFVGLKQLVTGFHLTDGESNRVVIEPRDAEEEED